MAKRQKVSEQDIRWVCCEMSNFAFRRPKADEKTFLPEALGMHQSKSAILQQSQGIGQRK